MPRGTARLLFVDVAALQAFVKVRKRRALRKYDNAQVFDVLDCARCFIKRLRLINPEHSHPGKYGVLSFFMFLVFRLLCNEDNGVTNGRCQNFSREFQVASPASNIPDKECLYSLYGGGFYSSRSLSMVVC